MSNLPLGNPSMGLNMFLILGPETSCFGSRALFLGSGSIKKIDFDDRICSVQSRASGRPWVSKSGHFRFENQNMFNHMLGLFCAFSRVKFRIPPVLRGGYLTPHHPPVLSAIQSNKKATCWWFGTPKCWCFMRFYHLGREWLGKTRLRPNVKQFSQS